ncbi:MAG: Ig-like domain-containing protein [Burkholderiaceae bacterium]
MALDREIRGFFSFVASRRRRSPPRGPTIASRRALQALASNAYGISRTGSASISFDRTAPPPVVVDPIGGDGALSPHEASSPLLVTGQAEAGSTVFITWGALSTSTQAGADGRWQLSVERLPDGATSQGLRAWAVDAAGNAGEAVATPAVAVDRPPVSGFTFESPWQYGYLSGVAGQNVVMVRVTDSLGTHDLPIDASGAYSSRAYGTNYLAADAPTLLRAEFFDASGAAVGSVDDLRLGANRPTAIDTPSAALQVGYFLPLPFPGATNILAGDDSDQVLVGDNGVSVRNGRFEFWDTRAGAPDASDATMLALVADPHAAAGEHHLWNTSANALAGGPAAMAQTVIVGIAELNLSMTVSGLASSGTSLEIRFDGDVLGHYDGQTKTWSTVEGSAPQGFSTPSGDGAQTWTWSIGIDHDETAALQIISAPGPAGAAADPGLDIHRVGLSVAGGGNDLLVGGAGRDVLFGQVGDDALVGGRLDQATGAITHDHATDVFVYSMQTQNGNDVIHDFELGVDRIALIDVLDTAGVHRGPGAPGAATTDCADTNLGREDVTAATSPNQYLSVSTDTSGNIVIGLHGGDGAGASLGTITLSGVTVGPGAGQLASADLGALFDADALVMTSDGFSAERLLGVQAGSPLLI